MSEKFIFKQILLLRPLYFIVAGGAIGLACASLASATYPGFLRLILLIPMGILIIGIFLLSKTVTIWFDETHIYFDINGTEKAYLKRDLLGFYSFDYRETDKCILSMRFDMANASSIRLASFQANTDYYNAEFHAMLVRFLNNAEHELGFAPTRKSVSRRLAKIGDVWFSRKAD